MCNGTATKLLCSHYLVHWSGPRCPKRCVLPDRRVALACTCAACDPDVNRRSIILKYAAERDVVSARLRDALGEGRLNDARALEMQLRGLMGMQMVDMGRTRIGGLDPAVGCRWPGGYEQWVQENCGRPVDWDLLLNHRKECG